MNSIKPSIRRIVKNPLTVVCFGFAGYFVISQFLTFLENKDSSSIGFIKFQSSADPTFPAFTICLEANIMKSQNSEWRGIIDESLLKPNENMDLEMYFNFLRGFQQTSETSKAFSSIGNGILFENVSL